MAATLVSAIATARRAVRPAASRGAPSSDVAEDDVHHVRLKGRILNPDKN